MEFITSTITFPTTLHEAVNRSRYSIHVTLHNFHGMLHCIHFTNSCGIKRSINNKQPTNSRPIHHIFE
eukprot:UN21374